MLTEKDWLMCDVVVNLAFLCNGAVSFNEIYLELNWHEELIINFVHTFISC